ncbi:MAG: GNAT family N-acetyltransferase [Clostridia bacterium]|nr:GNAT family N-acetyltransferase [Clostridia bacterium]
MQFKEIKTEEFDAVYKQMEENFPVCEIRLKEEARAVLSQKDYFLYHIEEDGRNVGFISVWNLNGFCFIEHFVIYLNFRNKGLGQIALDLAKRKWKRLVLEAEPSDTELASRRLGFYKRNGFFQNSFKYMQPAYREGEEGVELVILSYPDLLDEGKDTVKEIYKRVYGR